MAQSGLNFRNSNLSALPRAEQWEAVAADRETRLHVVRLVGIEIIKWKHR